MKRILQQTRPTNNLLLSAMQVLNWSQTSILWTCNLPLCWLSARMSVTTSLILIENLCVAKNLELKETVGKTRSVVENGAQKTSVPLIVQKMLFLCIPILWVRHEDTRRTASNHVIFRKTCSFWQWRDLFASYSHQIGEGVKSPAPLGWTNRSISRKVSRCKSNRKPWVGKGSFFRITLHVHWLQCVDLRPLFWLQNISYWLTGWRVPFPLLKGKGSL